MDTPVDKPTAIDRSQALFLSWTIVQQGEFVKEVTKAFRRYFHGNADDRAAAAAIIAGKGPFVGIILSKDGLTLERNFKALSDWQNFIFTCSKAPQQIIDATATDPSIWTDHEGVLVHERCVPV